MTSFTSPSSRSGPPPQILSFIFFGHIFTHHGYSSTHALTSRAGFWLTFVAFILLFVGGASTCFGRMKDKRAQHTAAAAATTPAILEDADTKPVHHHTHEKTSSAADEEAAAPTAASNGIDEKVDHPDHHAQPEPTTTAATTTKPSGARKF